MEAIILLGPPGAGKGTIAEGLKEATDFEHVSTGDMLRAAVKSGDPVGLEAKAYMEKGELVPDDVIMRIVKARLEKGGAGARYMFDGFPRTLEQARLLDEVVAATDGRMAQVFLLDAPAEVLIERLSGRRTCRACGAVYHVTNIPPKKEGVCDECDGELYQRPDDNEATVRNRLDVYGRQTESLIGYYRDRQLLTSVNAAQAKEATTAQIVEALGQVAGAHGQD